MSETSTSALIAELKQGVTEALVGVNLPTSVQGKVDAVFALAQKHETYAPSKAAKHAPAPKKKKH